jgi:hypothetical protein
MNCEICNRKNAVAVLIFGGDGVSKVLCYKCIQDVKSFTKNPIMYPCALFEAVGFKSGNYCQRKSPSGDCHYSECYYWKEFQKG